MPDDNGGTECDLACQTKQILNSGNIAGVAQTTHQSLVLFYHRGGQMMKGGKKLIEMMNKLEDDAVSVQKFAKDCMGYDGPTGKMLL
jgi:hypothetical protein